ncbi:hypothetical protein KRR55_06270 [Paeniglutamicibacter sp. ABSL32-1]|uniref:hypothetical protein n=1 Tax=Paeniglutamicibacter quisquiliarum TaxID=2849498 RepID=UPI001C2CCB4A|nr:hypothetical protein [Paeniglutamicibacter quisquiliarum]MBV1778717.1 hypothetical protein [Paeniglutamicibacter quisquiliarum]
MDKYVVSFEQAKQLKKAGFPQDTVYKYYQVIVTGEVKLIAGDFEDLTVGGKHTRTFAAPMTDELRAQLPDRINDRYAKLEIRTLGRYTNMPILVEESLQPVTRDQEFHPNYNDLAFEDDGRLETLVNALSVLWLWCNENNYLERSQS